MKPSSLLDRRSFLREVAATGLAVAMLPAVSRFARATDAPARKMTLCLSPGSIGVKAGQREAIELAAKHGFESIEPFGDFLAGLSAAEASELVATLKARKLAWGAAGLSVEFRGDESRFADGLKNLPKVADGLQRAGVTRVGTWLMPGDNALTYRQNFKRHAERLRAIAVVLKDHQLRLGLEYVGTHTSRGQKYGFIHTLAEQRELIAEIGTGNVGVVLDSWHWWQAGDTAAEVQALPNEEVVSVDLNDAPAGVAFDRQQDGQRELPAATGVIDVGAFLNALNRIGYDGPVRAEPFNKAVNNLGKDDACAVTIAALKKAFALLTPA
ncbi:MAG: sugar phosphate isomerase/epimerase family protein [Verrucomicrobiota bacterium]|jgi:sugar phosphate isomerase/epimerase